MNDLAERNAIVLQHLPFVRRVAQQLKRKLPSAAMDMEDLVQEGVIGLIHAAARYDAAKNNKFEAYAYPRVRGSMLDRLRRRHWMEATQPQLLDDALPLESETSDYLDSAIEREERSEILRRAERVELEMREQMIVTLYYRGELSEAQIAPALRISESRVGQLRRQALRKLRSRCVSMGLAA